MRAPQLNETNSLSNLQDLADPAVDDDELVDLLIEQATLLSKTILRYLMVMT